jgi:choline dehydrogenase-like flavoprotein
MIIDALQLPEGAAIEADICIAGAGPAGLTLARELLARYDVRVCLVESGGLAFEPESQALSRLVPSGGDLLPPDGARRRQFGGAANAWDVLVTEAGGGVRYLPLSAIDFEQRDWLPHSGWPFPRDALLPYYERAQRLCGLGPFAYDADSWSRPDAPKWPLDAHGIETSIEQFGHASAFTSLHQAMSASTNLTLLLHANVTGLRRRDAASAIESVDVACLNGRSHSVHAGLFILACGATENARLLLLPGEGAPQGIGNASGLAGRYFMDHLNVFAGALVPASPALLHTSALYDLRPVAGAWIMAKLNLSATTQRRERLLNAGVRVEARPDPTLARAWTALYDTKRSLTRRSLPRDPVSKAAAVVPALPRLALVAADALRRYGPRSLLSWPDRGRYGWSERSGKWRGFTTFNLELQLETAPDPENRVLLTEERDRFGQPLAGVRWRWTELDKASLLKTCTLLAAGLSAAGIGTLRFPEGEPQAWVTSPAGAFHNLGATRMSDDPAHGVVDPDCRVHGVENLFVAGSSVFPTGGYANPTLTIVALSLRLADHVSGLLEKRRLVV